MTESPTVRKVRRPRRQPTGDLAQQAAAILVAARGDRTLKDLAERAGMVPPALYELEQGLNNPTLRRLERVAACYGIRIVLTVEPLPTAP